MYESLFSNVIPFMHNYGYSGVKERNNKIIRISEIVTNAILNACLKSEIDIPNTANSTGSSPFGLSKLRTIDIIKSLKDCKVSIQYII